jgi:hypothetical protein
MSPDYLSYSSAPAANAAAVEIQIESAPQRSLYLSLQVVQATARYMGRFHFLTQSGPFTRTLGFLTRLDFCNVFVGDRPKGPLKQWENPHLNPCIKIS